MIKGKYYVVDLCCGLGGLSLAAQQLGLIPIAGVDINKNALKTYEKNFPGVRAIMGDVSNPDILKKCKDIWDEYNSIENRLIVLSGPPCQGFSVAGSRNPKDPRNKVILSVAKAIASINPVAALIENVPRILYKDNLSKIKTARKILRKAGYSVKPILLNARKYGDPQSRLRAFFFITKQPFGKRILTDYLSELQREEKNVAQAFKGLPTATPRPTIYIDEKDNGPVKNHFAMLHSEKVKEKIRNIEQGKGPLSYRKLDPKKLSNTLLSGHRAPPTHPFEPRSITTREAARLQSIPDCFKIYGKFGSQMEQVTNAVPINLGKASITALIKIAG